MNAQGISSVVTGGASGLGRATALKLLSQGASVVISDLEGSDGATVAAELGPQCRFSAGDVTSEPDMRRALAMADELGPLRAVVHCAGRGGPLRIVDKAGEPASMEAFEAVVRVNLMGTFNVLRLAAAAMTRNQEVDDERGVIVLTASVAAYEGQIGQIPYAASKAAVVGMTIVAARDLAARKIRVCTIAPGTFDTPMLARASPEIRESLARAVPHPARLGRPAEFSMLAAHIIENPMMNGETVRLDGAIRMPPR